MSLWTFIINLCKDPILKLCCKLSEQQLPYPSKILNLKNYWNTSSTNITITNVSCAFLSTMMQKAWQLNKDTKNSTTWQKTQKVQWRQKRTKIWLRSRDTWKPTSIDHITWFATNLNTFVNGHYKIKQT